MFQVKGPVSRSSLCLAASQRHAMAAWPKPGVALSFQLEQRWAVGWRETGTASRASRVQSPTHNSSIAGWEGEPGKVSGGA